jgi:uncharacterized caspase-like protein
MRLLAALLVMAVAAPPVQIGGGAAKPVFSLEVPELNLSVNAFGSAALPYRFVNQLRLRVFRSPDELPYGQIFVRINGASAKIIMSARAGEGGILCDLDLNFRPGFLLQPGRNSVEAWATSMYGRYFYASFILDVQDEPASQREIRVETEVSLPNARPPAIRLTEPKGPVEYAAEVQLTGTVETPASSVTFFVSGKPVKLVPAEASSGTRGLRLERAARQFKFSLRVSVPPGGETIDVSAEDTNNNRTRLYIPVVRASREAGERYAVVVGISRYKDSRLNLRFAERDAAAMRAFLLDPAGGNVRETNLRYLVNEAATTANVRTALFDFLTKPQPGDLVFIYFAGHGGPDPKRPQNLYLVTQDTDVNNMGGTALPMWDLQNVFDRTARSGIVTFVDACHSAGVTEGMQNLTNQEWTRIGFGQRRAIITASDISQFSQESDQWGGGHGAFTYFLLQGLRGEADANRDLHVSVGELIDYVRDAVPKATAGAQTPTAMAGIARGLLLTQNPAAAAAASPRRPAQSRGAR